MTVPTTLPRVHLVAGGFPRGSWAGHDIDYVRLRLLELLQREPGARVSVANDYLDLDGWLPKSDLLVTYVAGPFPDDAQCALLEGWLEAGGRWLALHGTSGGKAVPLPDGQPGRAVSRARHHEVLGAAFLNHPPIRRFQVDVRDDGHPLTRGLPASFDLMDELYLLELLAPDESRVLLSTASLAAADPAPREFGFSYGDDTSVAADGRTRVLAYERRCGEGAVVYVALGHCHTPQTNIQPWVDASVDPDGKTPLEFRGAWGTEAFERLLRNGVAWGLRANGAA